MPVKQATNNLEDIIEHGKQKGYLTYDEVNSYLSDEVTTPEEIDHVFDLLDEEGINVVEPEEKTSSKEENLIVEPQVKGAPIDDPVKMYLKQMGQIPLLTREEELEMAERIENAEFEYRRVIFFYWIFLIWFVILVTIEMTTSY